MSCKHKHAGEEHGPSEPHLRCRDVQILVAAISLFLFFWSLDVLVVFLLRSSSGIRLSGWGYNIGWKRKNNTGKRSLFSSKTHNSSFFTLSSRFNVLSIRDLVPQTCALVPSYPSMYLPVVSFLQRLDAVDDTVGMGMAFLR